MGMQIAATVTWLAVGLLLVAAAPAAAAAPDLDWAVIYGDTMSDVAYWIEELPTAGYVVSGWADFDLVGKGRPFLMRLDSAGDTLWVKTYGDTAEGGALCVQETHDGGYILTGFIERVSGDFDALFIRTDADGDTIWTSNFDFGEQEYLYRVLQTPDRGFIATGFTNSIASPGSTDVLVIKIDQNGRGDWKEICGGPGHNRGYDICRTLDGNYMVTGYTEVGADAGDFLLIKIDAANGDSMWARSWGDTMTDRGRSVEATSDGGFVVAGSKTHYGPFLSYGYLAKTDAAGDTLWTVVNGDTSDYTSFSCVAVTPDQGFVCAGYIDTALSGDSDCYYLKTDRHGSIQWTKVLGKAPREAALCVTPTSDNGYASAGYSRPVPGSDSDVFIVKLEEDEAGAEPVSAPQQADLLSVAGPNPFTSSVALRLNLPAAAHVNLTVYSIEGRRIAVLENAPRCSGSHAVAWNLEGAAGAELPGGVYFIKCTAAGMSAVEKVVVLK
jgi:hypothetical protein